MKSEYDTLKGNDTWSLVSRPSNKKIIKNKWVYRIKRDQDGNIDKFKARLVARGDQQIQGQDYDETFAPVARFEMLRALLAVSVENEMFLHHMDVVSAYTQAELSDEIYMEQPTLFVRKGQEEKVCKLHKLLYGLKQAGREWYSKLNEFMLSISFIKSEINPCVYVSNSNGNEIIVIVYVDDLLITSADFKRLKAVKDLLKKKFTMNDLGPVSNILGICVERQGETGKIKLNQSLYIEDLLERFNMKDCKTANTPLEVNVNQQVKGLKPPTDSEIDKMKGKPYRQLVGSLLYLANTTRADIMFATNFLCRFCESPRIMYWKMAKHVLRYLRGTTDYSIKYEKTNNSLKAYVDSDWGGNLENRHSCSGFVTFLGGAPISWATKKQKCVALSTMESEYIALSEVTKEIVYLRELLNHMKQSKFVTKETQVFCDNQSAISLCTNNVYHARSKHIDIRFHFSREAQEQGHIKVDYKCTNDMAADILTKSLPRLKHERCVKLLGLSN